jgi:hypothetical protein
LSSQRPRKSPPAVDIVVKHPVSGDFTELGFLGMEGVGKRSILYFLDTGVEKNELRFGTDSETQEY